jgi:hypothetical protein
VRVIKFRGKRFDNGEWAFGSLVNGKGTYRDECVIVENINEVYESDAEIGADFQRVDPDTVGQFTGLADRKLKDVYEGDKIRFNNFGNPFEAVVKYRRCAFVACYGRGGKECCEIDGSDIEVVGNIHEPTAPPKEG